MFNRIIFIQTITIHWKLYCAFYLGLLWWLLVLFGFGQNRWRQLLLQCSIIGSRSWKKWTILYAKGNSSSRLSTTTISSKLPKSIPRSPSGWRRCSSRMHRIWLPSSSLQLDAERIRYTRRYVLLIRNQNLFTLPDYNKP